MVIFESTDRGATKVFDREGLLLTFERQNLNLVRDSSGSLTRINESDSWICAVEDNEIIERAKKHPHFIINDTDEFYRLDRFRIVEKVPTKKNKTTIVKVFEKVDTTEIKAQSKRLGALESQIILKDGSYSKSASPELISEYETLKKTLE